MGPARLGPGGFVGVVPNAVTGYPPGGRPRVVYWFEQATPSAVQRCNAVAARGDVDLEVWFNARRGRFRSWDISEAEWRFPYRFVEPLSVRGLEIRVPIRELDLVRPDLMVHDFDRAHLAMGFLTARRAAGRTAFRVLPRWPTLSHRTWWGELSKHLIFRAVDGAKVSGPHGAQLAGRYGLPPERTWEVTQSVNVDAYAGARSLRPEQREKERERLGLVGCTFLYVGRIWDHKGLDHLFDAYRTVSDEIEDVSLLMVGDGRDLERYRAAATDLRNVTFTGFIQESELPRLFGLSDVLVFPTLGDGHGLVVEEAMAAGLPVISSESAGNIRFRLRDDVEGYVVPPADSRELSGRMRTLAVDPKLRQRLASNAVSTAEGARHEAYAEDFARFVHAVLRAERRRTVAAAITRVAGAALILAGRRFPLRETVARTPDAGRDAASEGGGRHLVHRLDPRHHRVRSEALPDALATAVGQPASKRGVREQHAECPREIVRVASPDEQPRPSVLDDVGKAAHVAGDERTSQGHAV